VGAEDDVDPGGLVDDGLLVHLGHAAADGDLHPLAHVLAGLEVPQGAVELASGVVAHRAGVDDDDVGVFAGRRRHVSGAL
jgi:hypothetical protein